MPTPPKVTTEQIIAEARLLLEQAGLASLTVQAIADRVGVRAPSLYKRIRDRDDVIARVLEATLFDLGETVERATGASSAPRDQLTAIANATRRFAAQWPVGFGLLFAPAPSVTLSRDALAASVAPLMATTTALAGAERALDAARLVTAWLHGFVTMEQSGAFRLAGDVDAAFDYGLARILTAVAG